jgi:UDP-N-acetylglucosamine acyltransferase
VATAIHPTALVDPGAELADDVRVGAYAVVGPEVLLEAGVEIRPHALVTGRTRIGAGTRVFPFAVLGEEPQDKTFSGEATELVIGAGNVLREHVTIHVGTAKGGGCTRIGDDNFIMNGVHIAHDVQVGSHVIVASQVAIAGHAVVQDYAVIGGLSGVHQHARIGESAMVGALTGVTLDAPPFSLVSGERGPLRGVNVIGLRRRGFSHEVRREIKRAYQLLFWSRLRLEDALAAVRGEGFVSAEVKRLVAFIESSERGVSR